MIIIREQVWSSNTSLPLANDVHKMYNCNKFNGYAFRLNKFKISDNLAKWLEKSDYVIHKNECLIIPYKGAPSIIETIRCRIYSKEHYGN